MRVVDFLIPFFFLGDFVGVDISIEEERVVIEGPVELDGEEGSLDDDEVSGGANPDERAFGDQREDAGNVADGDLFGSFLNVDILVGLELAAAVVDDEPASGVVEFALGAAAVDQRGVLSVLDALVSLEAADVALVHLHLNLRLHLARSHHLRSHLHQRAQQSATHLPQLLQSSLLLVYYKQFILPAQLLSHLITVVLIVLLLKIVQSLTLNQLV